MQCPKCHVKLKLLSVSAGTCPLCGVKIYFFVKWRWVRGISCGLLGILVNYRWYPLEGSFTLHLAWLAAGMLSFFLLFAISLLLFPPEVDLLPAQGPICLDL